MTAPAPDLASKVARLREGDRVRATFQGPTYVEGVLSSEDSLEGLYFKSVVPVRYFAGAWSPRLLDVEVLEPAPLRFEEGDVAVWEAHGWASLRRNEGWGWPVGAGWSDARIAQVGSDITVIRRDASDPSGRTWRQVSP